MYKSERDIPLVFQGEPGNLPVITVEGYCKWYTLHVVFPDKHVELLRYPGVDNPLDEPPGECGFHDHVPNPRAVVRMAERLGYDLDEISLETMIGRWVTEVESWNVE